MRDPEQVPDVFPGQVFGGWKLLSSIIVVAVSNGVIGPLELDRESSEFLAIKLCLDTGPAGPIWERWIQEPRGLVHIRKVPPATFHPGVGYIYN